MAEARRDGDGARAHGSAPHCREYAGDRRRRAPFDRYFTYQRTLQEAGTQLESEHALVRWLAQQIADPNSNSSSQQMRLESDKHLVQIVTIHKSKGLEYPLVWLPFIANYRVQDQAFYHDRESFEAVLDLSNAESSVELAEAERLAEDLRLLYVALTRSVWHCSLGVAPLFRRRGEKSGRAIFI
jgi:exodeoxyribonuclease V beta subunit